MRKGRGEKERFVLLLVLCVGLIFVVRYFFLMTDDYFKDTDRVVFIEPGADTSQTVKNIYLDFWNPEISFIEKYDPGGFKLETLEKRNDFYEAVVIRQPAEFLVNLKDGKKYLFSGNGEMIWMFSDDMNSSDYYSVPEIYNVENFDQAERIISYLSSKSVLFRNYLSSVDAQTVMFYMRNANIILVNSWRNLEEFDEDSFIYQMGKNQIYDLFSTGRFLPIKK
jgi:hypothetical protein